MNNVQENDPASKIGPLLKHYRECIRLTQSYVAKKSGISSSMLSQIENSIVSPSVSTLFAICSTMGMDIAGLMKSINHINPIRVFRPDERSREDYSNAVFEDLIYQSETPNGAKLQLLEINPGQEISLTGKGKDVLVMGYILAGTVMLIVEEEAEYILKKGDSILFKSLCPHRFKNIGKTAFKSVWSFCPVGPEFPAK